MQATTTLSRIERRTWLLNFYGHEQFAALDRIVRAPLSEDQAELIDRFFDELESLHPAHAAVMNSGADLATVAARLLAEVDAR